SGPPAARPPRNSAAPAAASPSRPLFLAPGSPRTPTARLPPPLRPNQPATPATLATAPPHPRRSPWDGRKFRHLTLIDTLPCRYRRSVATSLRLGAAPGNGSGRPRGARQPVS